MIFVQIVITALSLYFLYWSCVVAEEDRKYRRTNHIQR